MSTRHKIKIGVVGLGRLGKKHAENIAFRIPNAELSAVCSLIEEEVYSIQKSWGIKYGYVKYSEMLENEYLDAIIIASSSGEHCKQIEEALDAGFHVFSEKPLGISANECMQVERAVNRHPDKVFMLGFMRRYDSSYVYAKEKIEEGTIGIPFLIRCYGLDPEKTVQGAIKFAATSGGIFLDMAIHDIDLARWYLNSEVKSIFALGGCYKHKEFALYKDADNATAIVQFNNGAMGLFYVGRTCTHGYHIETEIVGTDGSVRIGAIPEKNNVTIFNENGVSRECMGGFLERFEMAYLKETQEFVDCIIEKRKPAVSAFDGTQSTRIAYAAKESFEQNKIVILE